MRSLRFAEMQIIYADVNHDGEQDLVALYSFPFIQGNEFIIVMLWERAAYGQPFGIYLTSELQGGLHFSLEDWTGDGLEEIVWDVETNTTGSGYVETTYEKFIIRCGSECSVLWQGSTSVDWHSLINFHGRGIQTTDIHLLADPLRIETTTSLFHLPYVYEGETAPLKIFKTNQEIYTWTGSVFTPTHSSVLSPSHEVTSTQQLEAESAGGKAVIQTSYVPAVPSLDKYEYFTCQLEVGNTTVGDRFECIPSFTRVWWQDVTADGRDEVVVSTLYDIQARLLVWEIGGGYRLTADIRGDVIRSDLYGVRLENIDQDPELEILAGEWLKYTDSFCFSTEIQEIVTACWNSTSRDDVVYDWDGTRFTPLLDSSAGN